MELACLKIPDISLYKGKTFLPHKMLNIFILSRRQVVQTVNVFGRRQDPDGMYAAVIPKFIKQLLHGETPHPSSSSAHTAKSLSLPALPSLAALWNPRTRMLNQAAWGSVPRSIEMPLLYEEINIRGTLNMMEAATQCGVSCLRPNTLK